MKQKSFAKVVSVLLALCMMFAMSATVLAAIVYTPSETDDYYHLITRNDYELAPGISESEIVLNNDSLTHRQVAHVVEVDIDNPYTKVIPSYYHMKPTPGNYAVEVMSSQARWAESHGYGNVVAAMNLSLSWYDSQYYIDNPHLVGEPLGYMVLDGEVYVNSNGQTSGAQTCLVINFDEKDGVARPADMPKTEIRSTASAITGWEEQVIPANFGFLVKDGVNQYAKDHVEKNGASRSFVGIKENGDIVMVMNDGRQAPYSAGFTNYEMAEFMLSLGCVQAVNGDGGGSSAFLSQRPGEELKINCSPSDGSERETTHGILVISTAPATGEFARATIDAEHDYYTPYSSVQFSAVGSDLVGTAAEIPEDAVWQLADPTMGTIEDGLFVSSGKVGTATAQLVYDGSVVGEASVEIIIPEEIAFTQSAIVVPFGKTAQLSVLATINDGIHEVVTKEGDITLTLDNPNLGTLDGDKFTFAAVSEENAPENLKGTLTATLNHGDGLVITVPFSVGKGSDIVYDFEDQDLTGWSIYTNYGKYGPKGPNGAVTKPDGSYWYHGQNERGWLSVVDSTEGQVKNGDYALKVDIDMNQIYETGYHALNLMFPTIDTTDSLQIGFWIYIPYDARHVQMGVGSTDYDNGSLYEYNEGWHYIKGVAKNNQFYYINFSVDDRAPGAAYNYYSHITEGNLTGKFTFYIDGITVDYSTAVEDREVPVFGNVELVGNDVNTALNTATLVTTTNAVPTFEVKVVDDNTLGNSTGLNAASAKAFIDGKAVDFTYQNGKFNIAGQKFANGVHDIRFEIADNAGNSMWAGGKININAAVDTSSTVKVVPQNPDLFRPLIGSLYWMDVVATDIETVDKVEMIFDLDNGSQWELEGMEPAAGFTAEYSVQEDDNIATITVTRTGKNTQTGEQVLLSFPVRTWESTITQYEGYEDQTPATLVNRGIVWKKDIELSLQKGVITYVKDYTAETTGTFGMEDLVVETEIFFTNYTRASIPGAQEWLNEKRAASLGWHEHTVTELDDKAPTCTEAGYTGRTYCEVCDSVVDWGEVVAATGHSFDTAVDGLHTCAVCEGTYYYENGEAVKGWVTVNNDAYYFDEDAKAVNGEIVIDSLTYTFEDNKLTAPALKDDGAGLIPFWAGKQVESGWQTLAGKTYYINNIYLVTGITKVGFGTNIGQRHCVFDENGVLQEDYCGPVVDNGKIYFVENGKGDVAGGLHRANDGGYYYVSLSSGYVCVTSGTYGISESRANGLLAAGDYYFGADGRINFIADIDDNGEIGLSDMTLYAQLLAGWNVNYATDTADADGDGSVGLSDLTLVAQYSGGWGVTLG